MTEEISMKKYIKMIYPLSYIIRYSNVPRIKDESVAEHSFYVAAIVQKLYEEYCFDLGKALNMAISHDIIEIHTNDIPHLIKNRHPKLVGLLKKIEVEEAEGFPFAVSAGISDLLEDSVETKIVKLADAIQCEQYARNEKQLGNSGYMDKVIKNSVERIEHIRKSLEDYDA